MQLRDATTADLQQLAELHFSAVVHGYAHIFPASSSPPDVVETVAHDRAAINLWVLEGNGRADAIIDNTDFALPVRRARARHDDR